MNRPITSARLRRRTDKQPLQTVRRFELVCVDATHTTTFDVDLEVIDDQWRATLIVGGTPSKGAGCQAPDQRAVIAMLANWTQRAAEGMALIASEQAQVTTEVVEIQGSAEQEGEA